MQESLASAETLSSSRHSSKSMPPPGCDVAVQTDERGFRRDSDAPIRIELVEAQEKNQELTLALEDLRKLFEESKAIVHGLGVNVDGLEEALANFAYEEQREKVFVRLWKDALGRVHRPAKSRPVSTAGLVLDASATKEQGLNDGERERGGEVLARIVACRSFTEDPEPEPLPHVPPQQKSPRAGTRPKSAEAAARVRSASGSFANYCRRLREEGVQAQAEQQHHGHQRPLAQSQSQPQLHQLVGGGAAALSTAHQAEAPDGALSRHFVKQAPSQSSANSVMPSAVPARRRPLSSGSTAGRRAPQWQRSLPDLGGPLASSGVNAAGASRRPQSRAAA